MSFSRKLNGITFVAPAVRVGKKYSAYSSDGKYLTSFGAFRISYRTRHAKNRGIAGRLAMRYLWS